MQTEICVHLIPNINSVSLMENKKKFKKKEKWGKKCDMVLVPKDNCSNWILSLEKSKTNKC